MRLEKKIARSEAGTIATGELVDHATVRVNSCRPNESSDPPVATNGAPGLGSGTGDEVVSYFVTPFPENILGVMAEGNVHFSALPGEDTTLVMGAGLFICNWRVVSKCWVTWKASNGCITPCSIISRGMPMLIGRC